MGFLGIGGSVAKPTTSEKVFDGIVEKKLNEAVTVWATKPSKDAKVGIGLNQDGDDSVVIGSVSSKGLFKHSGLKIGMDVIAINGKPCPKTCLKAIKRIRKAEGRFSIETRLQSPHQLTVKATKVWPSDFLDLKFKKIMVDGNSDPIIIVSSIGTDSPFVGSGVCPGMQLLFVSNPQKSSMLVAKSILEIENYLRRSTGTIEVCVGAKYIYLGPWTLNDSSKQLESSSGPMSPLSESKKSTHTVSTQPADTTLRDDSEAGESFGAISPASPKTTSTKTKKKKSKSKSKKDKDEVASDKPKSSKSKSNSKKHKDDDKDSPAKPKSSKKKKTRSTSGEKGAPKKPKSTTKKIKKSPRRN